MKIALVTDAWAPQTNGVVRTLAITAAELGKLGHDIEIIEPGDWLPRVYTCTERGCPTGGGVGYTPREPAMI